MKTSWKTKLAYWWWRKFRFKEPDNKIQKVSQKGDKVGSLLILLPHNRTHLSISQHFLKTLSSHGHFSAVNKIVGLEDQKDILDSEYLQRTQMIRDVDVNKFGLLTKDSLKKIINGKFNAILNLDPELNFISAQIISSFNSEIRIGFSSDVVKDIYNVNIEGGSGNGYIEKGYKYILEVLGL